MVTEVIVSIYIKNLEHEMIKSRVVMARVLQNAHQVARTMEIV